MYNYTAFYRTYPRIVRTVSAQSKALSLPDVKPLVKVRTLSAQWAVDPEKLIEQLSYSHFEMLVEIDDPLKRAFYEHEGIRKHAMTSGDNPPVGILLCTRKNHAMVEYALAGMDNKLFVEKYQLELPKKEEMRKFLEAQIKAG